MKVIPNGRTARTGIQSCGLSRDSSTCPLTLEKVEVPQPPETSPSTVTRETCAGDRGAGPPARGSRQGGRRGRLVAPEAPAQPSAARMGRLRAAGRPTGPAVPPGEPRPEARATDTPASPGRRRFHRGGLRGSDSPPSPPPGPGGDAADTHAALHFRGEWSQTLRWRRHAGSWPPAAGTATRGTMRPPSLQRRQAREAKCDPALGGGKQA